MNFMRRAALLAGVVATSGALFAAGPATAAPAYGSDVTRMPGSSVHLMDEKWPAPTTVLAVQTLAGYGGYGEWNPNPNASGSIPGDSIKACDTTADGWGIQVWLDSNRDGIVDRKATTNGHDSPYCSGWKSGNLPENTYVDIAVIQVKGDTAGKFAQYTAYTS